MPTTRTPEDPVRVAVDTYAGLLPELEVATGLFVRLVTDLLDDAGINYLSVTGRTKSVASFAGKAQRVVDGAPLYPDPLAGITDQIGLRVITYIHDDVAAVASRWDPVPWWSITGVLGELPGTEQFGGHAVDVTEPGSGPRDLRDAHSRYFDPGTVSLAEIGRLVTGRG